MTELTDLEICKRIAEIENLMFCTGGRYARIEIWKDGKVFKYEKYNPLTDDALCFRLMVKYKVCVELSGNKTFQAVVVSWLGLSEYSRGHGNTLNRAICLSIIEANKE